MPNYPYKDKPQPKSEHKEQSFGQAGKLQLGTPKAPLQLIVATQARQQELTQLCADQGWAVQCVINTEVAEDIRDLEYMQNKPATVSVAKTPARNEPCSCGSGEKYKKCCG